jgi:hypothetical protein
MLSERGNGFKIAMNALTLDVLNWQLLVLMHNVE